MILSGFAGHKVTKVQVFPASNPFPSLTQAGRHRETDCFGNKIAKRLQIQDFDIFRTCLEVAPKIHLTYLSVIVMYNTKFDDSALLADAV